jgi:DNA-binding transcriptional ArsR family regulator
MTSTAMLDATCLIMAALAARSQHGYGIIVDVREISGGRVTLRTGTLYTALDRLRRNGLVEVDRVEVTGNGMRRYYRLARATGWRPAAGADRGAAHLRIGDADREAAAAALCEHFARGRLTAEELSARLDTALAATTQGEISTTTWDLP